MFHEYIHIITNKRKYYFFKVPEVPRKPVPEEKVPAAVPKIPEPLPSEGICPHSFYCKDDPLFWSSKYKLKKKCPFLHIEIFVNYSLCFLDDISI